MCGGQEERYHHGGVPAGRALLGRGAQRPGGLVPRQVRTGRFDEMFCHVCKGRVDENCCQVCTGRFDEYFCQVCTGRFDEHFC